LFFVGCVSFVWCSEALLVVRFGFLLQVWCGYVFLVMVGLLWGRRIVLAFGEFWMSTAVGVGSLVVDSCVCCFVFGWVRPGCPTWLVRGTRFLIRLFRGTESARVLDVCRFARRAAGCGRRGNGGRGPAGARARVPKRGPGPGARAGPGGGLRRQGGAGASPRGGGRPGEERRSDGAGAGAFEGAGGGSCCGGLCF